MAIYNIESGTEEITFGDKSNEVWRPVFSSDDKSVFFIKMNDEGRFEIQKYDIESKRLRLFLKLDITFGILHYLHPDA